MTLNEVFGGDDFKSPDGYHLIDFSQIVISNVMHTFKPEDDIDIDLMRHIVLNSIRYYVLRDRDVYPNIILGIDNATGGYWRRRIAPYYKKHRDKDREASGYDWDKIYQNMTAVIGELKQNMPYKVIDIPRLEADDIIAVLTKNLSEAGNKILITSADGDFVQLHKYKNVKQWSPVQKRWVLPKFGSAERDLLTKIIKGDSGDTIANVWSRSDFLLTKNEGERQKSVSSKLLAEAYTAKDPRSLFTGDALLRYNENESLISFDKIPVDIEQQIMSEFETVKAAPRRMVRPYFVKNRLAKLLECESEF